MNLRRLIAVPAALALALGAVALTAVPAQAVGGVVSNLNDSGPGSLRDAVATADLDTSLDTITFTPGLTGTIPLTMTLYINESLIIDGTGADIIVSRVNNASFDLIVADFTGSYNSLTFIGFDISNDALAPVDVGRGLVVFNSLGNDVGDVTLTDMVFVGHDGGASAGGGGAISIYESTNLTITRGSISSSQVPAGYSGGGLYFGGGNYGSLTIDGTTFQSNRAGSGGAFYVDNVNKVTITGATFRLNNAFGAFPFGYGGAALIQDIASDGVDIANTTFDENSVDTNDGGALFINQISGPVGISGSTISNNTAAGGFGGGLLSVQTGSVSITNTDFSTNSAEDGSGGAHLDLIAGDLDIDGSTFVDNEATQGNAGGLFVGPLIGAITINASSFRDNEALAGGGVALYAIDAPSTITDSEFLSNTALAAEAGGLKILNLNVALAISRTTFGANDAQVGGVALDLDDLAVGAALTIDSSVFGENTPTTVGTQEGTSLSIGLSAGTVSIVNSTFSEPSDIAPAIFFDTNPSTSALTISHATITSGFVGVYIRDMSTSDFNVSNSIVAGTSDSVVVNASQGGVVNVEWSIFSGAQGASIADIVGNQFSTDPQLGTLADNGGPTATRLPLAGSPAINAGDPTFAAPPAFDQRGTGFPRVQAGRLDIGAVELQPVLAATGGTVSWWLLFVAGGVLILGVGALVLTRRRRSAE
jgi:LPXTG-motif cell wall-anchored protein